MVIKVHKYADGGKVVKDHLAEEPSIGGFVKDRAKAAVNAVKGWGSSAKKAAGDAGVAAKKAGDEAIQSAAPKSITQRKSRIDQAIEDAGG